MTGQKTQNGLYRDGRHYDLNNQKLTADIPFYVDLACQTQGPILELACGTGRLTIPIAEAGADITGLDITPSMLDHARAKAKAAHLDIQWIEGDIRNFELDRRFALIFLPFNSVQHLTERSDLEALFDSVHKHLAPGGLFVIDVFNPSLTILTRDPTQRFDARRYIDPDGRGNVIMTERVRYDDAAQLNHITWYYEIGGQKDARIDTFTMRCFYPQELDMLLHYNGFKIVEKYGDFDKSPFTSGAPKQIVVCKAHSA